MMRIAPIVALQVILQVIVQSGVATGDTVATAIINILTFATSILMLMIVFQLRTQTRTALGYTP